MAWEWNDLKSQFATSSWGGRRKLLYAFTEHGVLMLSSVLNSRQATSTCLPAGRNIQILRIFARTRKLLSERSELKTEISEIKKKVNNQDKNIELLFSYLDELIEKRLIPESELSINRTIYNQTEVS